jgi:hypothetical protein
LLLLQPALGWDSLMYLMEMVLLVLRLVTASMLAQHSVAALVPGRLAPAGAAVPAKLPA